MKHAQNSEIKSNSRAKRVTRDGNVKKKKKIIKILATLVIILVIGVISYIANDYIF